MKKQRQTAGPADQTTENNTNPYHIATSQELNNGAMGNVFIAMHHLVRVNTSTTDCILNRHI